MVEQLANEVMTVVETIDIEPLIEQMVMSNELLARVYSAQLFVIGVVGAVGVLFLLYRFIKSFY